MSEKNEASYYIVIPGVVRFDKKLSPTAKLLYGEIAAKCNVKGHCWATNQFFSEIFDCNIRSIQRHVKELEDAGHIRIEFEAASIGTERRIFLQDATKLSQEGVTIQSPTPDKSDTATHDTAVIQNTLTSLLLKENTIIPFTDVKVAPQSVAKNAVVKKTKSPGGEKTTYQNFIEIYDSWFKKNNDGLPPKIDGANGSAAKTLIGYFKKIVATRAESDGRQMDETETEHAVLQSWSIVLDNWDSLEPFYQEKTRLIDINSNIQNIIKQAKNGEKNRRNIRNASVNNGKATGANQLANLVAAELHEGKQS